MFIRTNQNIGISTAKNRNNIISIAKMSKYCKYQSIAINIAKYQSIAILIAKFYSIAVNVAKYQSIVILCNAIGPTPVVLHQLIPTLCTFSKPHIFYDI